MNVPVYKKGDVVKVINRLEGHQFHLGVDVTIKRAKPDKDVYLCAADGIEWWMNSAEFEKVDE